MQALFISPTCTPISALSMPFFDAQVALRPGQPVAIYRSNNRQCFHWFLAIIRAGGIAVPLNPLLSLGEVRRILADSGTEILVTDKAVFERNICDRHALNVRTWIQADDETETLDGFLRVGDYRGAVPARGHRSGRNGCRISYLRHQRFSQGRSPLQQCPARGARVHGTCRTLSGAKGPCAGRAAVVAHHGRKHCTLRPDGGHPRLFSRSF